MIENNREGERCFYYWRDNSAAKTFFNDNQSLQQLYSRLPSYQWLYLSGISLALFNEETRKELFDFIQSFRAQGGAVIFDSNYRSQL